MIAVPSRPSVRFTALEKPTIQKQAMATKPMPASGSATDLNIGNEGHAAGTSAV
jgi:hypothetical protein